MSGTGIPPRRLLLRLFEAAVARADSMRCVPPHLPRKPPHGRTVLGGAGKAAASMARALGAHWPHALSALVATMRVGIAAPIQEPGFRNISVANMQTAAQAIVPAINAFIFHNVGSLIGLQPGVSRA